MEWTTDTGEHVEWDWANPPVDESGEAPSAPYAIRIHVDGRRLRGREATQWKHRLGAEFPATAN